MAIGIGSALGAYEITALLGEGGMGQRNDRTNRVTE
jgi:hypothetical protein